MQDVHATQNMSNEGHTCIALLRRHVLSRPLVYHQAVNFAILRLVWTFRTPICQESIQHVLSAHRPTRLIELCRYPRRGKNIADVHRRSPCRLVA